MRVEARREASRRESDQRAERKDAIVGFLSATERVEQHRGQLSVEASRDAGDLIELMHAVWLAKKIIELVCSGTLAQAAQSSWRQPGGNSATQANHSYGAPTPKTTRLTLVLRRPSKVEASSQADVGGPVTKTP